jgi:hypothetical protein
MVDEPAVDIEEFAARAGESVPSPGSPGEAEPGEPPRGVIERDIRIEDTRRRMAYWMLGILSFMVGAAFVILGGAMIANHHSRQDPSPPAVAAIAATITAASENVPAAGVPSAAPSEAQTQPVSLADLEKLLTIMFGPVLTLIGTILGFYFGGKTSV